jgi:hypothetical protein
VGLLGCGGAGKHTRTTPATSFSSHCDNCGVSLHSPNHHYSVRQVEAAFASQGIHLHRLHPPKTFKQLMPGAVVLRFGSSASSFVTVWVNFKPRGLTGFVFLGAPHRSPRPRVTHHGDVIAANDSGHSAAVKSALAELH